MIALSGCCYFLSAGRLDLPRGWCYYLLALGLSLGGDILLFRRSPGLLNGRGRPGEDTEGSDKLLLLLLFAFNLILMPVVAGLDGGRFGWTPLPAVGIPAGVLLQLLCAALVLWAMLENPFFEGTMRLQRDRGQYAVSRGPYGYLRHPGYLGMALNTLSLPLIAGSGAALLPALAAMIIIVIRTSLEDRLLLRRLPGYRDYSRRVRYRLLPLLW